MPTFVPDPDLAAMMDQVVTVQIDTNASGAVRRAHGSVPRGPWVTVPGYEAVPAHGPCAMTRAVKGLDGLPVADRFDRWVFAAPVVVDGRHQIVWRDPDRGTTRYFFVRYESDAPGGTLGNNGQPLYWRADTDERGRGGLPV